MSEDQQELAILVTIYYTWSTTVYSRIYGDDGLTSVGIVVNSTAQATVEASGISASLGAAERRSPAHF